MIPERAKWVRNNRAWAGRALTVGLWRTLLAIASLALILSVPLTGQAAGYARQGSGWRVLASGIEARDMTLHQASGIPVRAVVLRLDPAVVTFRVHYSPGAGRSLSEWRAQLPQAAVIINGGFFDPLDQALGLLVSDGTAYGESLDGFGGMFQVTPGSVRIRGLVSEPYRGEDLWQAVQSFPLLVEAGSRPMLQEQGFDIRSRRTVIAQDSRGRVIAAVIPYGVASFFELQDWLLSSDLDVQIALALDGGRSTGLVLHTLTENRLYPAFDRLPCVIAVYPS